MVEVDSDIEDDFEVAGHNYFDLDGDGSITMKELITKLNPSASIVEKEELAVIVSSAPNFDLCEDGNINMGEMIRELNPSPSIVPCHYGYRDSTLASKLPDLTVVHLRSDEKERNVTAKEVPEPTWKKEANIFGMNPKMTPSAQGNLLRGIVNLSSAV